MQITIQTAPMKNFAILLSIIIVFMVFVISAGAETVNAG